MCGLARTLVADMSVPDIVHKAPVRVLADRISGSHEVLFEDNS
jgi:hypothetical protein